MITKRNGNGQTECVRCKEKGKFALNWDSFLYTFNDKPYCFDCLMEMLEEKDDIINKAIEYIKTFIEIDEETGTYSMPYTFDGYNLYKLLKMLEGEDKSEDNK